jgi:hypothetical protein
MPTSAKTSLEEFFALRRRAIEQREFGLIDGPGLLVALNRLKDRENEILRAAMDRQSAQARPLHQ